MDYGEKLAIGIGLFFAFVVGLMLGAGVMDDSWNRATIQRGLREHEAKTGRLRWTEKAGGESK